MDNLNLWYDIFDLLNFKSQLALVVTHTNAKKNLYITDINTDYVKDSKIFLSKNIIESSIFKHIKKFNCVVEDINDLAEFRNLKMLNCCSSNYNNHVLKQETLNGFDLVKLKYINCNNLNISHMTNLKILKLGFYGGINTNLKGLQLTSLHLGNDLQIYDISFMTTLKKLNIQNSILDQNSISGLDLTKFKPNNHITTISFMKNLKSLDLDDNVSIHENELRLLNLYELSICNNNNISDLRFMTTLKILRACALPGASIGQAGITGLDLIELYIDNNNQINDLTGMHNLKILSASGCANITQSSIRGLNLIELDISDCTNITDVSFMKSLKKLDIGGWCHVYESGIRGLDLYALNYFCKEYYKHFRDLSSLKNLKKLNGSKIR